MSGITYPKRFSHRLWAVGTLGQQRSIEFARSWCQSLLWTSLVAVAVFLAWQLVVAEPLCPPITSGLTLGFVCFIGGLGVGTNAAAAYMRELHRVNKMVADQNQELQAANLNLLRQFPLPFPVAEDRTSD